MGFPALPCPCCLVSGTLSSCTALQSHKVPAGSGRLCGEVRQLVVAKLLPPPPVVSCSLSLSSSSPSRTTHAPTPAPVTSDLPYPRQARPRLPHGRSRVVHPRARRLRVSELRFARRQGAVEGVDWRQRPRPRCCPADSGTSGLCRVHPRLAWSSSHSLLPEPSAAVALFVPSFGHSLSSLFVTPFLQPYRYSCPSSPP
jgi:hypothetical protein